MGKQRLCKGLLIGKILFFLNRSAENLRILADINGLSVKDRSDIISIIKDFKKSQ